VSRTFWLALICLISLGLLLAWRGNIGARPIGDETASILASASDPAVDDRPPLAKSDRLSSPYFDKLALKATEAIQILPGGGPNPAISPKADQPADPPSQPTADANEVTTWHWHAGSKITKRTTVAPRDSRGIQ
jgi:hypothetical protein